MGFSRFSLRLPQIRAKRARKCALTGAFGCTISPQIASILHARKPSKKHPLKSAPRSGLRAPGACHKVLGRGGVSLGPPFYRRRMDFGQVMGTGSLGFSVGDGGSEEDHSSACRNSSSVSSAALMIDRSVISITFIMQGDCHIQRSIGKRLFHPNMTAFLAHKREAEPAQHPDCIGSRNYRERLSTATSITRAPLPGMISSSGSRYKEIASRIFCFASLIVRPCVIQPGREGTVTTYHPSTPLVITTFSGMVHLPQVIVPVRTSRGLSLLSRPEYLPAINPCSPSDGDLIHL